MREFLTSFFPAGRLRRALERVDLRFRSSARVGLKIAYADYARENMVFGEQISAELEKLLSFKDDAAIELYIREFEEVFARSCGRAYAVGLNSGTTALAFSLWACGINPGDEVILPANTYIATAMAVQDTGAVPVFVDIDEKTFNLDMDKIPEKITARTRAVIPVHLYGHLADMDRLKPIADKYDLIVIEDACQAHGARLHNRRAGSFGETGCFSLHASKIIGGPGEGGMVVADDGGIFQKIKDMCEPAYAQPLSRLSRRTPARLSAIQSAVCRVKLENIGMIIEKKNELAGIYFQRLENLKDEVRLPARHPAHLDNFRNFTVRVKEREKLMAYLLKNGIETKIFYPEPIHLCKTFADLGYQPGELPETEKFVREALSLPIGIYLNGADIEYITGRILKFYQGQG